MSLCPPWLLALPAPPLSMESKRQAQATARLSSLNVGDPLTDRWYLPSLSRSRFLLGVACTPFLLQVRTGTGLSTPVSLCVGWRLPQPPRGKGLPVALSQLWGSLRTGPVDVASQRLGTGTLARGVALLEGTSGTTVWPPRSVAVRGNISRGSGTPERTQMALVFSLHSPSDSWAPHLSPGSAASHAPEKRFVRGSGWERRRVLLPGAPSFWVGPAGCALALSGRDREWGSPAQLQWSLCFPAHRLAPLEPPLGQVGVGVSGCWVAPIVPNPRR